MQLAQLISSCRYLQQLHITKLKRLTKAGEEVKLSAALLFWLYNMLIRLQILGAEEISVLIEMFCSDLMAAGDTIEKQINDGAVDGLKTVKLSEIKLGIMERRWACIDGIDKFLDLGNGEFVDKLEIRPIESVVLNLTALSLKQLSLIKVTNR